MSVDRAGTIPVEVSKNILPIFDVSPKALEFYDTRLAPAIRGNKIAAVDIDEPLKPMVPLRSVSCGGCQSLVRYVIYAHRAHEDAECCRK